MDQQEPVLQGICCEVSNCVHNNGNSCCTAPGIHVRSQSADPEMTMCETFTEI